ncbi:hypothetical protein JW906_11450 [bacterium]|nr:hypothetical protein [bacterium]
MKNGSITAILVLFLAGACFSQGSSGQTKENAAGLRIRPSGFMSALLDPAKFSMEQSYSVSFAASGSRSMNQGLYLNTLKYKFSDPLFAQVRIGYLHQPFGGSFAQNQTGGTLFVQNAMLRYKPTPNMTITLDYEQIPAPFFNPYYWSR